MIIDRLELLKDKESIVKFDKKYKVCPNYLCSYRGDYSQLAIVYRPYKNNSDCIKVNEFLKLLKSAVGKDYTGWKGGTFRMDNSSEVYIISDIDRKTGFNNINVFTIWEIEINKNGYVVLRTNTHD